MCLGTLTPIENRSCDPNRIVYECGHFTERSKTDGFHFEAALPLRVSGHTDC